MVEEIRLGASSITENFFIEKESHFLGTAFTYHSIARHLIFQNSLSNGQRVRTPYLRFIGPLVNLENKTRRDEGSGVKKKKVCLSQ